MNGKILKTSESCRSKSKELKMFNFEEYPQIVNHLKTISRRYHKHSSGWVEIFCPWCNDAFRKSSPSHGHLYISPISPFVNCFRCETKAGLDKLLINTGFQDVEILNHLKLISNITYHSTKYLIKNESLIDVKKEIIKQYNFFEQNFPNDLQQFKNYIYYRCLDIDPVKFFLIPAFNQRLLTIQILNADGMITNTRIITSSKIKRYIKSTTSTLYYFQNIENINNYKSIILTEGAFDLINLFNFYNNFNKNSFYVAIGGSNYKSAISLLINNYLMIGKYNINIIFDNELQHLNNRIQNLKFTINELNPQININFYLPLIGKDVSEMMLIKKI